MTLSCRSGDTFPRGLAVADVLFDPGDELRRVALNHLPDAGPKLVQEVDAHVGAYRRAKSFERRRSGAPPRWAVRSGDRDRSQATQGNTTCSVSSFRSRCA